MKKLYQFLGILLMLFVAGSVNAQITVYDNPFPGSAGPMPIPGGTPAAPFGFAGGNSDPTGSSGAYLGGFYGATTFDPDQLALWVSAPTTPGTNDGYAQVTGPLASYAAPFNSTLSSNIGVVTWTFNMRTSTASTGFGDGFNNAAVILAATDADVRGAGNGFAVAFDPGVASGRAIQLLHYSGGLTGGSVSTVISATTTILSTAITYVSVRVTYDPATSQWTIYVRDDGSGGFLDPSIGVTISGGSVIDATDASTAMLAFGCYANYSVTSSPGPGLAVQYAYFDNFRVTVTCPEITGGLLTCVGGTTALSNTVTGGVWSSSSPGTATVGASTGIVTGVSITPPTTTITYVSLGGACSVSAVVTVTPASPAPTPISGSTSVCMGSTITLSSGPGGGSWSSSNPAIGTVSTGGVVTGIAAGTVSITYALPGGCFSRVVVTVNLISPISGSLNMCEDQTTTFNNLATGGTWTSFNPAVVSINASTGLAHALTVGTAVISYLSPGGCSVGTTVTVNALPTPATGVATVCEGFSTTFFAGSPFETLLWSASPASIADVDGSTGDGVVTGYAAGTSAITYKLLATGCARVVIVTVNPAASITGPAFTVCVNATVTMNGTPTGGTWTSTTSNASIDLTTGAMLGVTVGTSVISYVLPTGCFRFTTITVNPIPTAIGGSLSVCKGSTTALTSGPLAGTWSSSTPAVGTVSTSGVVTGIDVNTTTITYAFTTTGCFNTAVVTVNALPTPITGNLTVCEGASQTLSSNPTGGTWSSGSTANATVGATSGSVTGVLAGNADITFTITATGCYATTTVTVIPQPAAFTGALSVCVGFTTTLSSTTTPISWTSGNNSIATVGASTGVVSGLTAGTVVITGEGANGCSRSVNVSVNPLPGNITGTKEFCSGATTTLSSSPSGGTWSSSNPGTASVNPPTTSGIFTGGFTTGTATVTYTLPTGCKTTAVVTVDPLPAFITGNLNVCLGLTTTLTSGTGGTWSSSTPAVGTVSTGGVVTGITAGTTNVSYILTSTGCFRTREVTVNPLPANITGPTSLCPATNITLSSTSTGGTWTSSTPANGTINLTTGVLTGIATGTTTITYTLPTGCITTVVETISSAPLAVITPLGDTALCPGGFIALTSSTTPGVTYQWFEAGIAIPGAVSPTYLTSTAGSYQVKVSVAAGCSTMSIPMAVSIVPATASITLPGGSASGCSGTGVIMDGTAGTGLNYQWMLAGSPIAGATNASFTAMTSGGYSLIVSNSTGCSATSATETIVVNAVPDGIVSPAGPLATCAGSTVSMTAGSGYTYQWHNTSGAIAGATSATYNAGVADNYWVVETNSAGCSTTSNPIPVTVNPLPDASITHPGSNLVFCVGGSANLFGVPGGGFTYQWYKDGTVIAGATNSSFIATATGAYKIKVTNPATGCVNMSATSTDITAVGAVTITPVTPSHFCWGGSSLLSTSISAVGSAVSYQWLLAGSAIPGATNSSYNATVAGDYSCTISVPASCVVTSTMIHVYENPLPDPLVSFDGTVFHTGNFYVSYQWYKNLVMIPGATSAATPATGIGNYKVAVTDTNGCQSVSTAYVLSTWHGSSTGVTTVNEGEVKIYPNPATLMVHVESNVPVSAVITSIDGRQIMSVTTATDINISKLASGVYMMMIYDNDHHLLKTEKLVKAAE